MRVWPVILNWNNGRDTIDCLRSINQIADPAISCVIVCDNASTDGSYEQIRLWLDHAALQWLELDAATAGWPDSQSARRVQSAAEDAGDGDAVSVVLVRTGSNLGYAGGNNVGLRLVMASARPEDAALILNNDTLLTSGCVSALAARLMADPRIGMCGATVVYARDGRSIQARAGARFQPWIGRALKLGHLEDVAATADVSAVEGRLDYILGAALLVSRPCLDAIGLMYEGYFLYFEEIDWCLRARRAGFRLGYAADAVVLHKEGATIGSSHLVERRSLLADHYITRSRVRFTARFYPWFLASVMLYTSSQIVRQLLRRDWARARVQARALFGLRWQA